MSATITCFHSAASAMCNFSLDDSNTIDITKGDDVDMTSDSPMIELCLSPHSPGVTFFKQCQFSRGMSTIYINTLLACEKISWKPSITLNRGYLQ